ncbi:18722_t:CDS:2, partial [Racocetra fulgida]
STAASETVATPVTKNSPNTSTSVSQNIKGPDIFSHQATFPIQQTPFKHPNPTQPVSVVAISALLEPDQRTEELLGALSIEQLTSIENTVKRVKKKKTKELKKHTNDSTANSGLSNNPATHARVEHSVPNTNTTPMLAPNPLPSPVNPSTTLSFVSSNVNNRVQVQDQQIHQQPNPDHQQNRTQQRPVQQTQNHSSQPQQKISPQTQTTSKQQTSEISTRPRRSDVPITNPNPNHALPATDPIIEEFEGVQWVVFTYSVKGNNKEYRIRIDVDKVNLDEIDEQFRHDNCLYPRANCTEDKYQGWKLAWLNQEEISGRRGLLQRAVDSFRNRDPSLRSRRVVRNEKIMNGTLRKRVTRDNDSCDASSEISAKRPRVSSDATTCAATSLPMKETSHQTTSVIAPDTMVVLTPSDSKPAVISTGKTEDLNIIAEGNPLEINK